MEISLFMLAFAMFWKSSSSIRCYVCEPQIEFVTDAPQCDRFNWNDPFTKDCPLSTKCFKKVTTFRGSQDPTSIIERGCAMQSESTQKKFGNKWQYVTEIHELEADCFEDSNELGKSTTTTHCYCEGDLCNGASGIVRDISAMTFMTVSLWLIFR